MSVFGFSTESSGGGDFLPIIKYDARAGRMFRVDRTNNGDGWATDSADITGKFKAAFDFENVETGWIAFPQGGTPSFVLVPMGTKLPPKPNDEHKNGVRFMLKLAPSIGGDKPVREIAGTSKAFLQGIEAVYKDYLAGKDANPGKLPVVTLVETIAVESGSGKTKSTNYKPVFQITGWTQRGDLTFQPKNSATNGSAAVSSTPSAAVTPPSTGSTPVSPPASAPAAADDDFG